MSEEKDLTVRYSVEITVTDRPQDFREGCQPLRLGESHPHREAIRSESTIAFEPPPHP